MSFLSRFTRRAEASHHGLHPGGDVECKTCRTRQPFKNHICIECGKDPWKDPNQLASFDEEEFAPLPQLPSAPILRNDENHNDHVINNNDLIQMKESGIKEEWAIYALKKFNGNVEMAYGYVIDNSNEMNEIIQNQNSSSNTTAKDILYKYEAVANNHAECAICFEPLCSEKLSVFKNRRNKRICHHFFHSSCCENLSNENHKECPLCRIPFHTLQVVPDINVQPNDWFDCCDKDHDGELNTREVFEILRAQFPIDHEQLEKDLPTLWSRWDPSMDGQIQKEEFLGPQGLLSFVKEHFVKLKNDKGPVPDICTHKNEWFAYFDEDSSGELSQEEVVRGLIKSFHIGQDLRQVEVLKQTVSSVWFMFDSDGSGEIDKQEFLNADGMADSLIASRQYSQQNH